LCTETVAAAAAAAAAAATTMGIVEVWFFFSTLTFLLSLVTLHLTQLQCY
jgi:hypothetical protein